VYAFEPSPPHFWAEGSNERLSAQHLRSNLQPIYQNAEARRAVIAQVLAYAAYLWGLEPPALEQGVLSQHLQARGYESLAHAVESNDQEGSFDADTFSAGIAESLRQGHFRLVFVLDEAPDELVRLSSYLETMSDQLIIDLITLSAYTVNGSQILIPQRVEGEPQRLEISPLATPHAKAEGHLVEGPEILSPV
jgi:hypothetical protein